VHNADTKQIRARRALRSPTQEVARTVLVHGEKAEKNLYLMGKRRPASEPDRGHGGRREGNCAVKIHLLDRQPVVHGGGNRGTHALSKGEEEEEAAA